MTTRRRYTLYNTPPEYAVGDIVTIKKHKSLSYNVDMENFNGVKVTIRSISILDATNNYGYKEEFLKVHNGCKICMYHFENPFHSINTWAWYFYDFKESYKKNKIKLYKNNI